MLIIKFGGTVIKRLEEVVSLIKEERKIHQKILIVTSAIGRYPDPYATDTLSTYAQNLNQETFAQIVSCGEIISGIILVNRLLAENLKAKFLSIEEMGLVFEKDLKLLKPIDFGDADIVVVPGFVALKNGKKYLLPRGGSNLTAVFLADYCKANLLIVSDTDGLYEHNPKLSQSVKLSIVSVADLIRIIIESPRIFPIEVIKYLKRGNFVILYRDLISKNGSLIGNFFKNSLF